MYINEVVETMNNRMSLRKYAQEDIMDAHLDILLECAIKAPTAGNQMLYSILTIKNDETKEKLSKTCNNQAFIKKAPLVLIFLADYQKWFDYFQQKNVLEYADKKGVSFKGPDQSHLLLAIEDAMIAAQNVVIAGESLNIGSCYIGNILENYEKHKEILNLPDWVLPIGMLTLGYYPPDLKKSFSKRFDKSFVVFEEQYKRLSKDELEKMFSEKEMTFNSNNPYKADNMAQVFYARKFVSESSQEMVRSVKEAMKNWL